MINLPPQTRLNVGKQQHHHEKIYTYHDIDLRITQKAHCGILISSVALDGVRISTLTRAILCECHVELQGLLKVGIKDTLVFLICLMGWDGCLSLKGTGGSTNSGFNNSLDGGDCLHGGHYADDLAAN